LNKGVGNLSEKERMLIREIFGDKLEGNFGGTEGAGATDEERQQYNEVFRKWRKEYDLSEDEMHKRREMMTDMKAVVEALNTLDEDKITNVNLMMQKRNMAIRYENIEKYIKGLDEKMAKHKEQRVALDRESQRLGLALYDLP